MNTKKTYKIYFAGALFAKSDIFANTFLATEITRLSEGRYEFVLPQDLEQREVTPKYIRDQDLKQVLACDGALFNYDGTELDSGTLVEYIFAKFADKPSVIMRTDIRLAGDQTKEDGHPWNLMTSFFPRTNYLILDSLGMYKEALAETKDSLKASKLTNHKMAQRCIEELDKVFATEPLIAPEDLNTIESWIHKSADF